MVTPMIFELSEIEEQSAKTVREAHRKCQHATTIGGQFEYRFIPTGLGYLITIKCVCCNEISDITDYSSW
jgi:hypothetical protein